MSLSRRLALPGVMVLLAATVAPTAALALPGDPTFQDDTALTLGAGQEPSIVVRDQVDLDSVLSMEPSPATQECVAGGTCTVDWTTTIDPGTSKVMMLIFELDVTAASGTSGIARYLDNPEITVGGTTFQCRFTFGTGGDGAHLPATDDGTPVRDDLAGRQTVAPDGTYEESWVSPSFPIACETTLPDQAAVDALLTAVQNDPDVDLTSTGHYLDDATPVAVTLPVSWPRDAMYAAGPRAYTLALPEAGTCTEISALYDRNQAGDPTLSDAQKELVRYFQPGQCAWDLPAMPDENGAYPEITYTAPVDVSNFQAGQCTTLEQPYYLHRAGRGPVRFTGPPMTLPTALGDSNQPVVMEGTSVHYAEATVCTARPEMPAAVPQAGGVNARLDRPDDRAADDHHSDVRVGRRHPRVGRRRARRDHRDPHRRGSPSDGRHRRHHRR